MNAPASFADDALTLEQAQLLDGLARSVTATQARWISGYFAGMVTALSRGDVGVTLPIAAPAADTRALTILYGTETGNARALAKSLGEAAGANGLTATVADMADYKPRKLKDEQDLLVVVSTYGEGDPPQPSTGFFEFIEGPRAPKLDGLRFAVLSLGDSTYEKYCEAGKRLDRRFAELGAERLAERVDCDVDYDDAAAVWSSAMVETLAVRSPVVAAAALTAVVAASAYDKRNPFPATVLENIPIVGRHSTKETRHLELDITGSGLVYEPGDALGVVVANDPAVVEALIAATGLAADAPVTIKGESVPLAEALASRFEASLAAPRFLDQWAKLSGAATLTALQGEDKAAERLAFLRGHHLVDIVRQFPVPGVAVKEFVAGLRPLQPRLYSLASSLAAVPDEAHLTVAPVRYDLHGEPRAGVASALLAERAQPGDTLPVYVQSNPHFRLPADDVPIIMVGAGTGVAPYRGFLQEREVRGAGGKAWLFFGERNFRSDFLYQAEWQDWLKAGTLSRMDVAFSRDKLPSRLRVSGRSLPRSDLKLPGAVSPETGSGVGPPTGDGLDSKSHPQPLPQAGGGQKVYVQHRIIERAAELWAWLEEGAHVYVCGDATAMAPDVHKALAAVIAEQGGLDTEGSEDYLRRLIADNRYQRDVY